MRLILYAILGFILYYLFKGLSGKHRPSSPPSSSRPYSSGQEKELKMDPVCGTYIPEDTPYRIVHKGKTYYFCSEACKKTFQKKISEREEK